MVEPRVDFGSACSNMIDLNYEQNDKQDKDGKTYCTVLL